jgi:hypothetical protein
MSTFSNAVSNDDPESDLTELQEKVNKLKEHIEDLKGMKDCKAKPGTGTENAPFRSGIEDFLTQMEGLSAVLLGSNEKEDEIQRWINLINHHFRSRMPIPALRVAASNRAARGKTQTRDPQLIQQTIVDDAEALCNLMVETFESKRHSLSSKTAGSPSAVASAKTSVATVESDFETLLSQFPAPSDQVPSRKETSENGGDSPTLGRSTTRFTILFTGDTGDTLSNPFKKPETSNSVLKPRHSHENLP